MNPIDPAELSAYLDGELSPDRAREVEAAMVSSAALRAEFIALLEADHTWRAVAHSAAFRPDVRLRRATALKVSARRAAGGMSLLLAARFLPKLADTLDLDLILNGIALAIALVWVIRMTRAGAHNTTI